MMRLIFPTKKKSGCLDNKCTPFSKARYYTAISLNNSLVEKVEVLNYTKRTFWDSDILIVKSARNNDLNKFDNLGIKIYSDDKSKTLNDSIDKFLLGKLKLLKARL